MILHIDCFCGLAGDMLLGAFVDAGLPLAKIKKELAKLPVKGYSLTARKVMRGPMRCTNVTVKLAKHGHPHTSAKKILSMIGKSRISDRAKATATAVFRKLAVAEGRVHGIDPAKVHFHEVGAVDSIVDIVGNAIAMDLLDVDRVTCSAVPASHGTVRTQHGLLPVPAPATTELLRGFPLVPTDITKEIVTPTGAAILSALAVSPGRFPNMTLSSTGYGAGDFDIPQRPNFMRILLGEAVPSRKGDAVLLLETNLDDIPGEDIGFVFDALFEAGALDVWTTAIQMKKSRPGVLLSLLAASEDAARLEKLLLEQTTTFGVRRRLVERTTLNRDSVRVKTKFGSIRMKTGAINGKVIKVSPEFDDIRAAARKHGISPARVREAALRAWK